MIKVSDSAKAQAFKLIQEEQHPDNAFIRVGVKGGGCSGLMYELIFDSALKEGDQVQIKAGAYNITDLRVGIALNLMTFLMKEFDHRGDSNI